MRREIVFVIAAAMMLAMAGCGIVPAGVTPEGSMLPADTTPVSVSVSTSPSLPEPSPSAAATPVSTPAETATPAPTPLAPPEPLTVTKIKLKYSDEYTSVDIVYPEISGMADATAQSGINDQVTVFFEDMADALKTQAKSDSEYEPGGVYYIRAGYEVKRNDGMVLSITMSVNTFEGGPNTGLNTEFINVINSDPAQQPALEELFNEDADYASVLDEKIGAQIAEKPNADEYDFTGVSAHQGYYLTDTDLVIVFQSYSIIAGIYGEPEFEIPLDELKGMLIPGIA